MESTGSQRYSREVLLNTISYTFRNLSPEMAHPAALDLASAFVDNPNPDLLTDAGIVWDSSHITQMLDGLIYMRLFTCAGIVWRLWERLEDAEIADSREAFYTGQCVPPFTNADKQPIPAYTNTDENVGRATLDMRIHFEPSDVQEGMWEQYLDRIRPTLPDAYKVLKKGVAWTAWKNVTTKQNVLYVVFEKSVTSAVLQIEKLQVTVDNPNKVFSSLHGVDVLFSFISHRNDLAYFPVGACLLQRHRGRKLMEEQSCTQD